MADRDPLLELKLPRMDPVSLFKSFGPGMILMMTGIGTSHLLTAPAAGGRFEYALLWCIPVAYVFKYYGFEMAFRFTHATGRSMLDAYATAPRKWPLWYVMVTTLMQCAIGQAGRLAAASAVAYYFFAEYLGLGIPIQVYGVALGSLSVAIILVGRYAALELVTKIMAAMLFISTVAVYLAEPAPISAMGRFFVVEVPDGSWLIIAAFLGLLPTGIDVSLQASEWGKAKKVGMGRIRGPPRVGRIGAEIRPADLQRQRPPGRYIEALRPHPRVLPSVVLDWRVGLSRRTRGVDGHRDDLPPAVGGLALSKFGRRQGGDRGDRRDLHPKRRPRHDAGLSCRCVRRHFLDGIQLLRWVAAGRCGMLSKPVFVDVTSVRYRPRRSRTRAPKSLVL